MNLEEIQIAIANEGLDGWLFYDFLNRDKISYRILGLNEKKLTSRRWFYFIPSNGIPQKLVSKVEPEKLSELPGNTNKYLSWREQHLLLKKILGDSRKICMQYSPNNNIPYVSLIDAGTLELIRTMNLDIVSSGELVQMFEGRITSEGFHSHKKAGAILHDITNMAFKEIGKRLRNHIDFTEQDIQNFMMEEFKQNNLKNGGIPPQVAVNEHAANPHFDSSYETFKIKKGDLILIDSWGKLNKENSIFYDFTWMAYAEEKIPERIQNIWEIVTGARDLTVNYEKNKIKSGEICYGWELDDICRNYVKDNSLGKYFLHRTGHSIGQEIHGNAVNIDNLETKDDRKLIPGILHSIEPGVYIPEEKIGIRSEINVFINYEKKCLVTGPIQKEIIKIV